MREPILQNLVVYLGRTFDFELIWRARLISDDIPDRIDMTGWTGKMQVRISPTSDVLLELSTENGKMVLGSDGSFKIHLDPADLEGITVASALYDVKLTADEGTVIPFLYGKIKFVPQITE